MSSEISDYCELSQLLLFVTYFASQGKGIKFSDFFFDVSRVNKTFWLDIRYPQQATVAYGNNYNQRKILDSFLDLNYFSFSNPNQNSNPKHLTKHQTLSPNNQISLRYVE